MTTQSAFLLYATTTEYNMDRGWTEPAMPLLLRWSGLILSLAVMALLVVEEANAEERQKQRRLNSNKNLQAVVDKEMKEKKELCFSSIDRGQWGRLCTESDIMRTNCALRCLSPLCYSNVYASNPLEEGEIDTFRGSKYRSCTRKELKGGP